MKLKGFGDAWQYITHKLSKDNRLSQTQITILTHDSTNVIFGTFNDSITCNNVGNWYLFNKL